MGKINLEGQYGVCNIAQKFYDHPCLNLVCGHNKYSGICNYRELMEPMRTPTLEVSQRIEDILSLL